MLVRLSIATIEFTSELEGNEKEARLASDSQEALVLSSGTCSRREGGGGEGGGEEGGGGGAERAGGGEGGGRGELVCNLYVVMLASVSQFSLVFCSSILLLPTPPPPSYPHMEQEYSLPLAGHTMADTDYLPTGNVRMTIIPGMCAMVHWCLVDMPLEPDQEGSPTVSQKFRSSAHEAQTCPT